MRMNRYNDASAVFDRLQTLGDETRTRLLLLLEDHEMTVSELCAVVQLPQSTVSRHLRVLVEDGWLRSRAEGTSRHYRLEALDQERVRARLRPDFLSVKWPEARRGHAVLCIRKSFAE